MSAADVDQMFNALSPGEFGMNDSAEIESVLLAKLKIVNGNNDVFFVLSMGCLVFLMQCGFAFLEAGSVRSKNTTNILIKNLLDSCISALCYFFIGWSFAYGEPSNCFIGYGQFALVGIDRDYYKNWFFQFVFAAAASTIVSGALAERCEFVAYFAYCSFLTAFAYPVISHWVWAPGGWLSASYGLLMEGVGMKDFAGSGVVHLHGGSCALIGAILLGPRIGRFPIDYPGAPIKGHSVPFTALGGFLLILGFFAFNGGSQISITQDGDGNVVALAMINTMLSGAAAGITGLIINKILLSKQYSLLLSINTALTGMVSICAGCDSMSPWSAVVTGIIAAMVYICVSQLMICCKIDDPLDAVAVHFGGGIWGLMSAPFLMQNGLIYGGQNAPYVLAMNCIGAVTIITWSVVLIGGLFYTLKVFQIFRVSPEIEIKGLDRFKHGEDAYPRGAYGHGWGDEQIDDTMINEPMNAGLPTDTRWAYNLPQARSQALNFDDTETDNIDQSIKQMNSTLKSSSRASSQRIVYPRGIDLPRMTPLVTQQGLYYPYPGSLQ